MARQQQQQKPEPKGPTVSDVDLDAILAATNIKRSEVLGSPDAATRAAVMLAKAGGLDEIRRSLPESSRTQPTRFFAGLVRSVRLNPDLANCSLASLLEALKLAALVDVVPGDGRAYLIPYKGEAKFELGAHGMRDVLRRCSDIVDLNDQAVYKGDDFEFVLDGPGRGVHHVRKTFGEGREWIASYATATLRDDPRPIVELLDSEDIAAIQSVSKAPGSLGWTKFRDEMTRAKVLRRLSKRLPMRPDDAAALQALDAANFYALEASQQTPERREPARATVPLAGVKPSTDPNRGHDHAAPKGEPKPKPEPKGEPEDDGTPAARIDRLGGFTPAVAALVQAWRKLDRPATRAEAAEAIEAYEGTDSDLVTDVEYMAEKLATAAASEPA